MNHPQAFILFGSKLGALKMIMSVVFFRRCRSNSHSSFSEFDLSGTPKFAVLFIPLLKEIFEFLLLILLCDGVFLTLGNLGSTERLLRVL